MLATEMKALLVRVAEGDGSRVVSELNRLTYPPTKPVSGETLTCVDFATEAIEVREARLGKDAKAAAAKRRREAAARKRHLEGIVKRADAIWAGLDSLMDEKKASAYDGVATQLTELREAYEQTGRNADFHDKLTAFRETYSRRPAMMRRIRELQ